MKYTIISLNDNRKNYKDAIHERTHFDYAGNIPFVNGLTDDMDQILKENDLRLEKVFKRGELGIWLSEINCWKWCVENNEELIVFEDDAILDDNFSEALVVGMRELPEDYHYLTLWTPDNQRLDYHYNRTFNNDGGWQTHGPNLPPSRSLHNFGAERLATAYQGYGNVAMVFSPLGADRLIYEARKQGLYTPLDCFIFQQSFKNLINGYAFKPQWAKIVKYDWPETTIHTTDFYKGE